MTSFVALLRGINVGGRKPVPMSDLRSLAEDLGFTEVKTLLQSGNLLFRSGTSDAAAIERQLEKESARHFGHPIDFLVRNAAEWRAALNGNPFPKEAAADPGHLLIVCLKDKPDVKGHSALKAAIKGREYFQVRGRELYLVYPDGIGRSKLTLTVIENKLGTRGTGRNWNTAGKIAAQLEV